MKAEKLENQLRAGAAGTRNLWGQESVSRADGGGLVYGCPHLHKSLTLEALLHYRFQPSFPGASPTPLHTLLSKLCPQKCMFSLQVCPSIMGMQGWVPQVGSTPTSFSCPIVVPTGSMEGCL